MQARSVDNRPMSVRLEHLEPSLWAPSLTVPGSEAQGSLLPRCTATRAVHVQPCNIEKDS